MAFKPTRPRPPPPPPPHDENARNIALIPGKASAPGGHLKASGLKPLHPNERKILSDISNKLQPLSSKQTSGTPVSVLGKGIHAGKTGAENVVGKTGFSILEDGNLAASKPPLQSLSAKAVDDFAPLKVGLPVKNGATPCVPLRNTSNGKDNLCQDQPHSENSKLASQAAQSSTKFQFPPSSKLKLDEEMEKKVAVWAEEGIERVHFNGQDIEALRAKIEEEEMEKRIACVLSYRTDLPLPRRRPLEADFWKISDVLKLDPVEDLQEDECPLSIFGGAGAEMTDFEDPLLIYMDFFNDTLPPNFSESWPQVGEDPVSDTA